MGIIFIHGINQEHYESEQLKTTWADYLEQASPGLIKNMPTEMAYYATTLARFTSGNFPLATGMGSMLDNINVDEVNFYYDILQKIADANGLGSTNGQLTLLEDKGRATPMGGPGMRGLVRVAAALESIAPEKTAFVLRFLKQAYTYLTMSVARRAVDKEVRPAIERNPQILITHSLGTVVAYNILEQMEKEASPVTIPLLITLGSPLALEAVKARLNIPRKKPANVHRWVNFYDMSDFVTLAKPLNAVTFAEGIENDNSVNNFTDNSHSIEGYLPHTKLIDLLKQAFTTLENTEKK